MKNNIYDLLISKVTVTIIGNNRERIIKRLKNNNIEIFYLKYIDNGIKIKIYKKDYDKLLKIKTIYKVDIVSYSGLYNFKNKTLNNKYIIISILICFIFIYLITNMIFNIDIITNNNIMKEKIKEELKINGISKYKFKKNYNDIQIIKKNIINKYKEEIDWIEIEVEGTKYIVRYEPRVKTELIDNNTFRNIIASKDAIIKEMYISEGQIIKSKNTYVKKGDIVVSGYIYLNGSIRDTVSSKGKVYGECWYNVIITYPFNYYEEKETGNNKNILVIKFLNKEIELFNFNKYKEKKVSNLTILKNNLLPIKLYYQNQKEIKVIDEKNSEEELIEKAINYSKKKIESNLTSDEYINNYKILSKDIYNDSIKLNIFFSVIEDITEYQKIEEYK